ncbi:MAG: serine hydrolase [Gemmatimonadaceae bacterium]|nr:serine hydrolase [Gemmatimonadaceae bacterium]
MALNARALVALVALSTLAACAPHRAPATWTNPHAAEPIGTVRQMYDGTLSAELAVTTFRNIDRLFPSRVVARSPTATPLPAGTPLTAPVLCSAGSQVVSLDEYVRVNRVSGLLVLKDGRVVLERYAFGNTPRTHWMSMSIAKSVTSTLIGIALAEGRIASLDDSVTRYVPSLAGSAYAGVSVRQVLMMASGVRWNETYTDSSSDRRHLLEAQVAQRPGDALALMGSLPRAATPGTVWNYSTGETLVAGEIVRGAVGVPLADYLGEKLWKPLGMESEATWWLDSPDGHEIAGSGLTATLRDYARFGQFVLDDGVIGGRRIVPAGWFAEAGSPKSLPNGRTQPYGYMWWPVAAPAGSVHEGAFSAQGIFGQYLYVNPRDRVVIAQWSAQVKPSGGEVIDPDACFGAITAALRPGR